MHDFQFFGGGMMFFWWILIILLVIVLVRAFMNNQGNKTKTEEKESPLDVLKKRYARGEIDKEEFEERKKDLL